MATFEIKRRDAKTGNKHEKVVRKLSLAEAQAGRWARAAIGSLHHFFIEGTSVCGRPQPQPVRADAVRKLCPECYTALNRVSGYGALESV